MTKEQRDAWRKLCEAATPGPWSYYDRHGVPRISIVEPGHETFKERICDLISQAFRGDQTAHDGRFIAASHPQAILSLLDAADERDAALRALRGEVGSPEDPGVLGVYPNAIMNEIHALRAKVARYEGALKRIRNNKRAEPDLNCLHNAEIIAHEALKGDA